MEALLCPNCEVGALSPATFDEVMEYRGMQVFVPGLRGHRCANCGEYTIFADDIRANQAIFQVKKAEVANSIRTRCGMLDGNAIRTLRTDLGLTQVQFARALGCPGTAISKYERGEVLQSAAVDRFLRMIRDVPQAAEYIRQIAFVNHDCQWTPATGVVIAAAGLSATGGAALELNIAADDEATVAAYSTFEWAASMRLKAA